MILSQSTSEGNHKYEQGQQQNTSYINCVELIYGIPFLLC